MLDIHVVFLGGLIGLFGSALYARDTWRGTTQPNRVTWILWTLAPTLALIAEIRAHVGWQWVMTFVIAFGPLLVLVASFTNGRSVWKIGPFDYLCGAASIFGLVIWAITSNDTVALLAFMAADGLASLPTIVKAYKAPETETLATFVASLFSSLLTLATVTTATATTAEVAFPIQITVVNLVFIVLIGGRIGPRIRRQAVVEPRSPHERVLGPAGRSGGT